MEFSSILLSTKDVHQKTKHKANGRSFFNGFVSWDKPVEGALVNPAVEKLVVDGAAAWFEGDLQINLSFRLEEASQKEKQSQKIIYQ